MQGRAVEHAGRAQEDRSLGSRLGSVRDSSRCQQRQQQEFAHLVSFVPFSLTAA
jgi:hypothetical protein